MSPPYAVLQLSFGSTVGGMTLVDDIDVALGESVLAITYTTDTNRTTHLRRNIRQRHSTLRVAVLGSFAPARGGLMLVLQTFEPKSAICMAECTLRTDVIPGVGPSSDLGLSVELRPSCRSSDAASHGLQHGVRDGNSCERPRARLPMSP
jgi:hypothetical protein